MKIIKPGSQYDQQTPEFGSVEVFLAGSIEMGKSEDWQSIVPTHFQDKKVTFYNPRRDEWDSSWAQEQSNPQFNFQVNWELSKLDKSDIIFMYFSPETKSPISLLELGAFGKSGKMIVCCPEGFWRRGNVEIFCTRYDIPFFNTMEEAIGSLMTKISKFGVL